MNQEKAANLKTEAARLTEALAALKSYDRGSSRAVLLSLDEAVAAAQQDPSTRKELERHLVAALQSCPSSVAREYICSKLALVGSEICVPAVASLLADPELATGARNALEAIPGSAAGKALRANLGKLEGRLKVGVINSLGARRDAESTPALIPLLQNQGVEIAQAAAAALGEIGTVKAAKALRAFLPKAPEALKRKLPDALLICAERLRAAGREADAQSLYHALATASQPAYIQEAAARGIGKGR